MRSRANSLAAGQPEDQLHRIAASSARQCRKTKSQILATGAIVRPLVCVSRTAFLFDLFRKRPPLAFVHRVLLSRPALSERPSVNRHGIRGLTQSR